MAQDDGPGEELLQFPEQGHQRGFLSQRTSVARMAVAVQTALVADADAVAVVVLAMGADVFYRTAAMDGSVARQVVVVADVLEAAVTDVVLAAGFIIQVPPLTGGGTVEDDQRDASHRLVVVTNLQTQGACHGRGYGDDHFEDDL